MIFVKLADVGTRARLVRVAAPEGRVSIALRYDGQLVGAALTFTIDEMKAVDRAAASGDYNLAEAYTDKILEWGRAHGMGPMVLTELLEAENNRWRETANV